VAVVLALGGAILFGVGMTLQQHDARQVPFDRALRLSTLTGLLQRPLWLAGVGLSGTAFLLQIAALRVGTVVVVQPIVTAALVVCLALTSWWRRSRLGADRWTAISAVVIGLFLFLRIASPRPSGSGHASHTAWLVETLVVGAVIVSASALARARAGLVRGISVGVAAGTGNAYVASVARGLGLALHRGVFAAARTPYPYVLLAAAAGTVMLVQAVYQADAVHVSLPVGTFFEAVGSLVLGIAVLGERPELNGPRGVVAVVAFSAAAAGLVLLARAEADRLGPGPVLTAADRD
jgi:hypothetical protein